MNELILKTKNGNTVIRFCDVLNEKNETFFNSRSIFITDSNVFNIYQDFFEDKKTIVVTPGDENKNLNVIYFIIEQLIDMKADRNSNVVGVGGGMVTDIAGFAASVYMRGISFGFIPTTLLAMIDASIGGKNGVNFESYKNTIGTFTQPKYVLIDHNFLKSLPDDEYMNGMAEAIKHYAISDIDQFNYLDLLIEDILRRDDVLVMDFIKNQVKIKVDVVEKDEKESHERKKLNFGHTFGHPIEKLGHMKHGYAVSIGMVIAAKISQHFSHLHQGDVEKLINLLLKAGLPVETNLDKNSIIKIMLGDKKKNDDKIDFIMLDKIGNAIIKPIKINDLIKICLSLDRN
jgi:3-dehydroquinate synthase